MLPGPSFHATFGRSCCRRDRERSHGRPLSLLEFWLSRNSVGQGAARALPLVEFFHRSFEVGGREVRPALREKDELGEGTFPKQEIGEALLAAGADEQIHFG